MLTRVKNALIKHLSPLASKVEQPPFVSFQNTNDSQSGFEQHSREDSTNSESQTHENPSPPPQSENDPPQQSNPFIAIFSQLKSEKSALLGWLGKQSYSATIKKKDQAGKTVLGVMLDKKAE